MHVTQSGPALDPIVNIQETTTARSPVRNPNNPGPSVFVTAAMDSRWHVVLDPNGFVDNEAGQVAITVEDGSLIQAGSINANQVNLTTMKGSP